MSRPTTKIEVFSLLLSLSVVLAGCGIQGDTVSSGVTGGVTTALTTSTSGAGGSATTTGNSGNGDGYNKGNGSSNGSSSGSSVGSSSQGPAGNGAGYDIPCLPNSFAIHFVAPKSGPTTGGTLVKIFGCGLTSHTIIRFGGVEAESTKLMPGGALEAVTPAHAAGVVDVSAENDFSSPVAPGTGNGSGPTSGNGGSPNGGSNEPQGGSKITTKTHAFTYSDSIGD